MKRNSQLGLVAWVLFVVGVSVVAALAGSQRALAQCSMIGAGNLQTCNNGANCNANGSVCATYCCSGVGDCGQNCGQECFFTECMQVTSCGNCPGDGGPGGQLP